MGPSSTFPSGEPNETDRNDNPATNGCILSGDISGNDGGGFTNYSDNCYHVVIFDGLSGTPRTELDAFTVRGGSAPGVPGGGGILISQCDNVRILRCRVTENQAVVEGGGIKLVNTEDIEIRHCEIIGNRTTSTHGGEGAGAGIQCKQGTFNLITTRVRNNVAAGPGGGLAFFAGTGTTNVFNCDIRGNSTLSNSAMEGGGIWGWGSATLVIANSLIADNQAGSYGGGVFSANFMSVDVRNCTIAHNSASTSGGGIYLDQNQSATILNSILWGNTASSDAQIDANGVTITLGYSDIQGVTPSGTIIADDPEFVAAGPNGVYALTCNSPCVDAGHDNSRAVDVVDVDEDSNLTELSPLDVEGYARVIDRLGGTDDVDMGSCELQSSSTGCPGDANHDGMVDADDIIAVVLHWGACGSPSAGCFGDVHTHPCGNGSVDSDDMTYVILFWGDCPGFFLGAPEEIPQDFQDCMEKCAEEFPNDPVRWAACVASCWEATGGE